MQIPRNRVEMTRKMKAEVSDDNNGNLIARPLRKWRLAHPTTETRDYHIPNAMRYYQAADRR
jgi:hypothetical protein